MSDNNRKKRLSENKQLFSESSTKNVEIDVPAIMLDNVSKDYSSKNNGETNSLKQVNIRIKKGEFVFVIGDSGAGKSTLLKLLMKEINPTLGKVYVNGKNLKRLRHSQVAKHRRHIGMVFQDYALFPHLNVENNIKYGLALKRLPREDVPKAFYSKLSVKQTM